MQKAGRVEAGKAGKRMREGENIMEEKEKDEKRTKFIAQAKFPSRYGEFKVYAFQGGDGKTHLALVNGNVEKKEKVAVRIHSMCITGDALGSMRCDCGQQLEKALEYLSEQHEGILLYMNQEGRGIGLANKIKAYALQDKGLDTVEANHQLGFADDLRGYESAADMLKWLEIKSIMLISNNPRKIKGLKKEGIKVEGRIPIVSDANASNARYLYTKKEKMGHILDEDNGL
ncbi:MAG: GTP cyclohydrolase II [Candidatus Micrarchaeota archaeon]